MWTKTFYLSPIEMIEGTCNQVFYQSALTAVRVKLREKLFYRNVKSFLQKQIQIF